MTTIDQAATELIDRFLLHDNGAPVDLSPLEEIYRIKYVDMAGTGTHGFIRQRSRRPTPDRPATVYIDKHLDSYDRRLIYIHEIAHHELGHLPSLKCAAVNQAFDDRQERDACRFMASVLIVPPTDILDWSVPMIAANCRVPRRLVELWNSAW